jgi:hypothetical protein
MASNSLICNPTSVNNININFSGQTVSTGQTWIAVDNIVNPEKSNNICVEISSLSDDPSSAYSAITQYSNCYDCLTGNNAIITFSNCFTRIEIILNLSEFSESEYNLFTSASTFYLKYLSNGSLSEGCFTIKKLIILPIIQYNELINANQISSLTEKYSVSDCQTCLSTYGSMYEVENCLTKDIHYIILPTNIIGSLISYTDGIDEFCGTVISDSTESTPTHTFVLDYGKQECEICLDNANNKILLVNCLDSEYTEVVWGSQLFANGSISNLSNDTGCFEVSGETTDPVTINYFLNFEPHTNCDDCLECNGVYYQYSLCSDSGTTVGEFLSYQIIPLNGVFYHPIIDDWCVRIGASNTPSGTYDILYSVLTANSCESTQTKEVWEAYECNQGFRIYIVTDVGLSSGNIVQAMWGDNNIFCVELSGPPTSPLVSGDTVFASALNGMGDTLVYGDCQTCFDNTRIGVTSINCETKEVVSYDLKYLDWGTLTNYGDFDDGILYNTFLLNEFTCVSITELCPKTLSGNLVTPVEYYYDCIVCSTLNPERTYSAGTEYLICNICEDCCGSGATSTLIVPPHPTWTRPDGRAVVLLDAVSLGGMFGLNS